MKDAAGGATSAKAAAPVPAIAEAKEQEAGAGAVVFHLDGAGVSFEVPKGSLTVIVGAVGSAQSSCSLLAGILGEMKRKLARIGACADRRLRIRIRHDRPLSPARDSLPPPANLDYLAFCNDRDSARARARARTQIQSDFEILNLLSM